MTKFTYLNDNIIFVLIILLPIALVSGPFFSDLIVVISSLLFILNTIIKKKYKYFNNYFFFFFFSWFFIILFSSLLSENILFSLNSSLFYFRFIIFALVVWYLLEEKKLFGKYFTVSLILTLSFVIFDGLLQYFYGSNIFGFKYEGFRLSGIFNDEKILGSFISRLIPLLFGLVIMFFNSKKKVMIFSLILLILSDILIFIAGERTAFFYLMLSTIIIIILISKWKLIRILSISLSAIAIILIILTNPNVKDRMLDYTLYQILQGYDLQSFDFNKGISEKNIADNSNALNKNNIKKFNIFSIQHEVIYITSLKIFLDNKFIGIGPKMFRLTCKNQKYKTFTDLDSSIDGCQTHPHNTYIQLLTETGVIGFLPIFFLFISLTYVFIRDFFSKIYRKKSILNDQQVCFLAAIYITLWPFIPTGNFFNNWLSIIYYLPIGFILYEIQHKLILFKKNVF